MSSSDLDESTLELWEEVRDRFVRERVLTCAGGLAARDFSVIAVPFVSEANRSILGLIGRHTTVYYCDDPTLEETGILDTLSARGNTVKDASAEFTRRSRRRGLGPGDVYMTSACAITLDGILVHLGPEAIPAFTAGMEPGAVVVVAGVNKIVDDLEEGFRRAKDVCVPQYARRMGLKLRCVASGNCVECDSPPPICTVHTVVTRKPDRPDIVVVVIGERLGY